MSNYAFEGPKWASNTVTWSLATTTYSQDAATPFSSAIDTAYQSTINQAVQDWDRVTGLTLTQVPDSSSANIRIGFGLLNTPSTYTVGYTNYHWVYNTAGQKVFTPDTVVRLEDPGQLALNSNGTGGYNYQGFYTTLYQTVLHELGHALGLDHSTDVQAIMSPSLGLSNQTMDANDISGIQALYAATTTVTPPITTTPTTQPTKTSPGKGHKALAEANTHDSWTVTDLSGGGLHSAAPGFLVPNVDQAAAENTLGGDWGDGVSGVPIDGATYLPFMVPSVSESGAHQYAETDVGLGGSLPIEWQFQGDWAGGGASHSGRGNESFL